MFDTLTLPTAKPDILFPANGTNHDRFASLAAVYPQLRLGFSNPVAGTGAIVLNGVGGAISAPFRLGGAILAQ